MERGKERRGAKGEGEERKKRREGRGLERRGRGGERA